AVTTWLQTIYSKQEGDDRDNRIALLVMQMQSRLMVGITNLFGKLDRNSAAQLRQFDTGTLEQRWRYIILMVELSRPKEALQELDRLDEKLQERQIETTEDQKTIHDLLHRLYHDYADEQLDAPSLTAVDRSRLQQELGWFGQLALAPAGGPDPVARQAL